MSPPNPILQSAQLMALPRLPLDEGGPVFAEPWQATAFALAVRLSAEGHFTWKEWAATLADELKAASERGAPDDGSRYYHHWLTALERLVVAKQLSDPATLLARKEAWAFCTARLSRHSPLWALARNCCARWRIGCSRAGIDLSVCAIGICSHTIWSFAWTAVTPRRISRCRPV